MLVIGLEFLLGALVLSGCVYHICTYLCVAKRLKPRRDSRSESSEPLPPVSILKPLHGADPCLFENLSSFCNQDYPKFEILFGVRYDSDPAINIVEALRKRHPAIPMRLVVAPDLGMNPKSAILNELVRQAEHPLLAISDSDIRVRPDYLRRLVSSLQAPGVGVVTCLYTTPPKGNSLASILDALHVNLRFLPSAAMASCLPNIRFGFGATLAVRKEDLQHAGGYSKIADHLADDYMLSELIRSLGLRVALADFSVEHRSSSQSFSSVWQRELRWSRTILTLGRLRYASLLLTFPAVWAAILIAVTGAADWSLAVFAAAFIVRMTAAWLVSGAIAMRTLRRYLPWLPLRDCLDLAVWLAAWVGSDVTWQGKTYHLLRDGRLTQPIDRPPLFQRIVRRLDAFLRAREHIFEFTQDPQCLFRINIRRSRKLVLLQDGTSIARGERYAELHFWNEHIPPIKRPGAELLWARTLQRNTAKSLRSLAMFFQAHPELRDVRAVFGRATFVTRTSGQLERVARSFEFEFHGAAHRKNFLLRLHDRGEDLLIWALSWTFNPTDRNRRVLVRPRHEVWLSRQALIERYGSAPTRARQSRRQLHRDFRAQPRRAEVEAETNHKPHNGVERAWRSTR